MARVYPGPRYDRAPVQSSPGPHPRRDLSAADGGVLIPRPAPPGTVEQPSGEALIPDASEESRTETPARPGAHPRAPRLHPPSAPRRVVDPAKQQAAKAELLRKTVEFQRKRAAQGWPDARYELGLRYWKGEGVEQNLALARIWLQAAAQQGHARAAKALEELLVPAAKTRPESNRAR